MSGASFSAAGKANFRGARSCRATCTIVQSAVAVMHAAQALWGAKAITILQQETGASERTVRYWRAGTRAPSLSEAAPLLRSEDGLAFLAAIMDDAQPLWWRTFKQQLAVADVRRMERAARRRLEEALDADADLAATIDRAEALLMGDADHARRVGHAPRARAGLQDRALAAAGGRARRG